MTKQVEINGKTYFVFPLAFIQSLYEKIVDKYNSDPRKDINKLLTIAGQIVRFSYKQGYMKPDEGKEEILMTTSAFRWFEAQYEEDSLPF